MLHNPRVRVFLASPSALILGVSVGGCVAVDGCLFSEGAGTGGGTEMSVGPGTTGSGASGGGGSNAGGAGVGGATGGTGGTPNTAFIRSIEDQDPRIQSTRFVDVALGDDELIVGGMVVQQGPQTNAPFVLGTKPECTVMLPVGLSAFVAFYNPDGQCTHVVHTTTGFGGQIDTFKVSVTRGPMKGDAFVALDGDSTPRVLSITNYAFGPPVRTCSNTSCHVFDLAWRQNGNSMNELYAAGDFNAGAFGANLCTDPTLQTNALRAPILWKWDNGDPAQCSKYTSVNPALGALTDVESGVNATAVSGQTPTSTTLFGYVVSSSLNFLAEPPLDCPEMEPIALLPDGATRAVRFAGCNIVNPRLELVGVNPTDVLFSYGRVTDAKPRSLMLHGEVLVASGSAKSTAPEHADLSDQWMGFALSAKIAGESEMAFFVPKETTPSEQTSYSRVGSVISLGGDRVAVGEVIAPALRLETTSDARPSVVLVPETVLVPCVSGCTRPFIARWTPKF